MALALACLLFIIPSKSPHAADVVSHLPKQTLGYALMRNIGTTDQKIAKLIRLFNPGVPSPLVLAKSITGLSEGIDLEGDAVFAYLANGDVPTDPIPLVLLPVTSYTEFASAVGGDTSGEICRVRMAEAELLVAHRGNFALVMNVEHRDVMRQVLATQTATSQDSFADWTAGNDVSIVLSRYGLAQIARFGWFIKTTAEDESFGEQDFGEPALAEGLTQRETWPLAEFLRKNFREVGVGLMIDEASNAKLRWKGEFLAPTENSEQPAISPQQRLEGLAKKPYAVAGGGELPVRAGEVFAEFMTNLAIQDAQQQGRSEFTRQEWAAERKSWDLALGGVREVSLLLVPPSEGEPLLSTFFARLTVDDSAKYLASLRQSYDLANDLTTRSTSEIKMLYDIIPATIGDVEGISITSDLDKATGDQNVEVWQAMLTACLGTEHELAIYCSPVDKEHVFIGLQSTEKLVEFIDGFNEREMGLANETAVRKTLDLFDSKVPYIQLINPQGLVEVASSWMKTLLVFGMMPQMPLYPTAPPIALSLASDNQGWQGEIVLPEESVQGLASFIAELEKIYGH